MDFSALYFGKPLNDLTYQDIERYFDEIREETTTIEFKSFSEKHGNFDKDIENVIRTVCGLLNSEGGIVVWGAPQGKTEKGFEGKVFLGELCPLTVRKDKDRIISKVSDSISPLPMSINVNVAELDGRFVYVFEVQKSNYAPHQYQNIYWIRINGQTRPAPHYVVDALIKRVIYPNIEGYIKFGLISHQNNMMTGNKDVFTLQTMIYIFNFSPFQVERNAFIQLKIDQGKFELAKRGVINVSDRLYSKTVLTDTLHYGLPKHSSVGIDISPGLLPNKTLNIRLTFGGETSPLKHSIYTLDFSEFNWTGKSNSIQFVKDIRENFLDVDEQATNGLSKADFLRNHIGR